MALPRVWLVPYLENWSFDITARALAPILSDRYEIRIAHSMDVVGGELRRWQADCVVDLWWHGTLFMEFGRRVLKQISSHRWSQRKWGGLKPSNLLQRYADDVGGVIVPSLRLLELLRDVENPRQRTIMLAPKGFDPRLFGDHGMRRGDRLEVGWVGDAEALDKHVNVLVEAFPRIRLADKCLAYDEMPDFYNGVDVIAVASSAEGDPRPLIEGMASGCFPVCSDVGIVRELIEHGVNGLIIPGDDRSPDKYREAFAWCAKNVEHVRYHGARNAERMLATRTWEHVAPAWARAIDHAIAVGRSSIEECPAESAASF